MLSTPCYAVSSPTSKLAPWTIKRREPRPNDVMIEIDYCGVCHSDFHQARGEWGGETVPMVAYERTIKGGVRYRFVIGLDSLRGSTL